VEFIEVPSSSMNLSLVEEANLVAPCIQVQDDHVTGEKFIRKEKDVSGT
jgi:hypothetical protein